jgi:hypothetical protein
MLCLGSSKYRIKQFVQNIAVNEEVTSTRDDVNTVESKIEAINEVSACAQSNNSTLTNCGNGSCNGSTPNASSSSVASNISDAVIEQLSFQSFPRHDKYFEAKTHVNSDSSNYQVCSSTDLHSCIPWTDSTTSSLDNHAIGRWGEALVYKYLLLHAGDCNVEWVNQSSETLASYDIIVAEKKGGSFNKTFVEVKSTKFDDKNTFSISWTELDFIMTHPRPKYDIYRVFNAGNRDKVRIVIVRNVFDLIQSKQVALCLAI